MPPGHEVVTHFMSQEDEDNGNGVTRSSGHPGGGHRQDEEKDMDGFSTHEKGLFLLLVTIPVQLLFVFVFTHFLSSLFDDTSHRLFSLVGLDRGLIDDHIRLGS